MAVKKTSGIEVKRFNRNAIFHYLYHHGPKSKQDVAYALNLSLPTVTQNIRVLQEQGLVEEAGEFESTGGRKAKALVFNAFARYAIGLDITRNHLSIVLVDLSGALVKNDRFKFPFENTPDYFRGVGEHITSFLASFQIPSEKILGVGIALPAIVSEENRAVTYAPVLDYTGGDIKNFSDYIPYPCTLLNDANAAGKAEVWKTRRHKNMVYLSLNNSVGGAILMDESIRVGDNQRGGEFGHMIIHPGGIQCYCGQKGCVDAYCNARVLFEGVGDAKLEDFFKNLESGNPAHIGVWETYMQNLALTVNNLRMIFDLDIILGGYVGGFMERHIQRLQSMVAQRNTFEPDGKYLKVCGYKLEATAVGAALYYIEAFIDRV